MSVIGSSILAGASGSSSGGGGGSSVYVDDVFSTYLFKGTGSALTVANGIDLAGEGGLVWIKSRTHPGAHNLFDTERGVGKPIVTDTNGTQFTAAAGAGLTTFNSNGFALGTNFNNSNPNTQDVVSWTFRKAPGFFDIVTWSGNGGGDRYFNHNLGSIPGCVIVKKTSGNMDWGVYHRSLGTVQTNGLELNNTNAVGGSNINPIRSTPTSTQIYIRGGSNEYNNSGSTYVAYIFAHDDAQFGTNGDESIIKCGSYTGVGSGFKEVDLGFEPQWVMIKNTGSSSAYANWIMFDNMRGICAGDTPGSSYGHDPALSANRTDAEGSTYNYAANFIDITPTGFKVFPSNTPTCVSGGNFIYMAIRRPNKPPTAATEVFGLSTQSGSPYPSFTSGFPVDFYINRNGMSNAGNDNYISARLLGSTFLKANTMGEKVAYSAIGWDYMTGFAEESNTVSDNYAYMFKRAPGFMDVIAYVGNGSVRDINHNLGVIPELIITKSRSNTQGWGVSSSLFANPTGDFLYLQASDDISNFSNNLFKTATNTTYGYGTASPNDGRFNRSNYTYVTFLFATLPGISKVGSYTGTGSAINVNCGFTNGARFILIKRTDSSSNWFVFDTLRGIVAGSDPFFCLNNSDSQTNPFDNLDPYNQGFTVTAYSGSSPYLNINGGTYLFLAIA